MSRKKKRTRPCYYKKKRKLSRKVRIRNKKISNKKNNNLTLSKVEIQNQTDEREAKLINSKCKRIRFKCKESFYINGANNPNSLRYFINREYIGYELDKNVYSIKAENNRLLTVSQNFVDKYFRKVG